MNEKGFIKIYRNLTNWEWYLDVNTTKLFIHCLLMANWEDKEWKGIVVKRGSFITSLNKLSLGCGLTNRQTRTSLEKLILTNNVTSKATNKYRVITIPNYETYQQSDKQSVSQTTSNMTSNTASKATTTKEELRRKEYKNNIKEKINKKEKFEKPTLKEVKEYIKEKKFNVSAEGFIDYYESNGWKVGKNQMKNWKATINGWNRRESNTVSYSKRETTAEKIKRLEREAEEYDRLEALKNDKN